MRATSISDRIWLVMAGVLLILTVISVIQAVAQNPQQEYYEQARDVLNKSDYREAAKLYAQAYDADTQGDLAGESLYWQAFSLYRLGEMKDLRKAVKLLERHQKNHSDASTFSDAEALMARVNGAMANRGDADAARRIHESVVLLDRSHATAGQQMRLQERELLRNDRELRHISRKMDRQGRTMIIRSAGGGNVIRVGGEESAKIAALNALVMMDEQKALPVIEKILTDPSPENLELRRDALFLLGQIDDDRAETILMTMAKTETDPEILTGIMMWLGETGSRQSLDAIMEIYRRNDDEEVRDGALFAIGQHGGVEALSMLREIAIDTEVDPDLRSNAIFALSQSDGENIGPTLMEIYRAGGDPDVLETAIFSLSIIDEDVPVSWFEEIIGNTKLDPELRGQALFAAGRKDAFSPDVLLNLYRQNDEVELKSQICYALAEMENKEALEALISIADEETDPELRSDIIFWIGRQDEDLAADYLLKIINGE